MTALPSRTTENTESLYRFPRVRSDREYVDLEQTAAVTSYLTEIARLVGIAIAGCCLLVALLAFHP